MFGTALGPVNRSGSGQLGGVLNWCGRERHILEVERRGADLALRVGAREFGYRIKGLPEGMRVGMTGCERINRFYEFVVHPLEKQICKHC